MSEIDSPFVCAGDKTTCDGVVVQGSPTCLIDDRPLAFAGAAISCKHGCVVVGGNPTEVIDGRPIAQFLYSTSTRGCKFVPAQSSVGGSRGLADPHMDRAGIADAVLPIMEDVQALLDPRDFVELRLVNQKQEPLPYEAFVLRTPGGQSVQGTLDADGYARIDGVRRGECVVEFTALRITYEV